MDTSVDYYGVLGVPATASRADIKASWSALVQQCHPDMGEGADAKKFMEVQKAFEVLGDEARRATYDRTQASPVRQVQEDYVPGWGEPASAGRAAAAPTEAPSADTRRRRPRTREWVPPHMREPEQDAQTSVQATQTTPVPEESAPERPRAHRSWRTAADSDIKPTLTKSWKALWLAPLVAGLLALVSASIAIGAVGEGVLATLTPALVVLLLCAGVAGVLVDWSRIQSGRPSTWGLAIGAVAALIVGTLGVISGNYWMTLTAVLAGFSVAYTGTSLHYKYVVTRQMPAKQLLKYAAFGKPGRASGSSILQLVEQDLADHLMELFQIPSVRIFHGVSIPAGKADIKAGEAFTSKYGAQILPDRVVGQAVTSGKRVAFLSSVTWPGGKYTLDNYGGVLINGQHTQFNLELFNSDVEHWKKRLKGVADVRLIVVVHADGPVSIDIPNSAVELVSADDVVDTLGTWLVEEQRTMDRELNAIIAEHLAAT